MSGMYDCVDLGSVSTGETQPSVAEKWLYFTTPPFEDATGVTVQFLSMALSLSPLIRFGTSTWTYECWQGQVYKRQYAKSTSSVQDARHSISDGS